MLDDRHRVLVRRTRARGLDPFGGIVRRQLGGALGNLDTLVSDIDARIVHHREHGHQSAMRIAHDLTDAFVVIAIGHHAGGGGIDAELVFERDAANVVARSDRTVGLHVKLRHDEERYAAAAFRRVGQACQDEVDNVLGQFVIAESDVDFLALDPIFPGMFAIVDRRGRGAQRADIASRLRFGQVHRARPFPADELGQIEALLRFAAVVFQRFDRADAQHRQEAEGHVGRAEIFQHVAPQGEGQTLPAECRERGDRVPALLDVMLVGFLEPGRQADHAVFESRPLEIAHAVERRPFSGGELADAFHDGFHHVRFGRGEAFAFRQFVDPRIHADGKQLVGGSGSVGHEASSWLIDIPNIARGDGKQGRYGNAGRR